LTSSSTASAPQPLLLIGPINDESGRDIICDLAQLPGPTSLRLYLSTSGGDLSLAASLLHELRRHSVEVRCLSEVASAGVLLAQCGRRRIAQPQTEFYTHPETVEGQHTLQGVRSGTDSFLRLCVHVRAIYAARSGRTCAFWDDFLSTARYFDSKEAKRLGLIDAID
jgi:ATP-dependent protease ClpP protease subunit